MVERSRKRTMKEMRISMRKVSCFLTCIVALASIAGCGGNTTGSPGDPGYVPRNGECGSANGGTFSTAPSSNLCNLGTPTTVGPDGTGHWGWGCLSPDPGGQTDICQATIPSGPTNGACGSANGGTFSTAPTSNLCQSGNPTAVAGSGPWNWSCEGLNGGTTQNCSANSSASNLTCPEVSGGGSFDSVGTLSFKGKLTFQDSTSAALANSTLSFTWGLDYQRTPNTSGGSSGAIRMSLWAVTSPVSSANFTGDVIGRLYPTFSGQGAYSSSQIIPGYTWSGQSSFSGQNPPAGNYCIVTTLEEHGTPNCASADGWCTFDWAQFPQSYTFY